MIKGDVGEPPKRLVSSTKLTKLHDVQYFNPISQSQARKHRNKNQTHTLCSSYNSHKKNASGTQFSLDLAKIGDIVTFALMNYVNLSIIGQIKSFVSIRG